MRAYSCGVPNSNCRGAHSKTDHQGWKGRFDKLHTSREEAISCHISWLESRGYKKLSAREYETPEGSILVLTKACRFGEPFRYSKEKSRWMPVRNNGPWITTY